MNILRVIFLLLSAILIALPWLHAPLAGNFVILSLMAIPVFLVDVILLLTARRRRRHHHRHHHHRPWYRKLNPWRIAFAIVVLAMLPMFRGYLPLFGRQTVPTTLHPTPLTLVSWNADNFQLKAQTLQASAQKILAQHPDIICLQERPHDNLLRWDSIKAAFPGYPYTIRNNREDEVLNLAILSKYPISNVCDYYYPGTYNKTMRADLQIGSQKVRLFNIHLETTSMGTGNTDATTPAPLRLTHNSVQRNQQAAELADAIRQSPYPVLLCGDFNDTRTGYAYRHLALQLTDLSRLSPLTGSYQGYLGLFKIDYLFYDRSFAPASYQLISNPWSDHKIQVGKLYF